MIFPAGTHRHSVYFHRWTHLLGLGCFFLLCSTAILSAASNVPPEKSAAFAKFDQWWQEYFVAPEESRAGLVKKGVELASQRRTEMIALIESDPESALRLAFPEEYHTALPKQIAAEVELHVRGLAILKVTASDKKTTKRTIKMGQQTWRAYFYGRRLQLISREEIPIHGVTLEGRIAVDGSPLERFPARESLLNALRQSEGKKTCPICGEPGTIPGAVGDLLMWFDTEEHLEVCEKAIIEKEMQPEAAD